ncbi:hypothetical protein H6764_01080 [Candidatus Nomurabacteria bacterium]|nr:hypothetical protein [Candidatus Nomurabacteria bacterium]
MEKVFTWLDQHNKHGVGRLVFQLFPMIVCVVLFAFFIISSHFFITNLINPFSASEIKIVLNLRDIGVGFFLYFLTAMDYAIIVGRMQVSNPGSKSRLIMNVATCVGCFFGVTLILFLWGFAKDITWLITPILIFAGSVMIKLGYEGKEYFETDKNVRPFLRKPTVAILTTLYKLTRVFTYWMPEIGHPKAEKMPAKTLAKWSFLLPFIIGTDDLIGYMGAMTVYNVFGLLFGIYLADIAIDILIFISPENTKKIVENAYISLFAGYAFLYLAYKSFREAHSVLVGHYNFSDLKILGFGLLFAAVVIIVDLVTSKLPYSHKHIERQ